MHTIRYGRMPQGDVKGLMRGLARDVRALLETRPTLRVVFIADGAVELWNLFDSYLGETAIGTRAIRLVDFWHLVEYLGKAASLLEARHRARYGQLSRWKTALLEEPGAAKQILAELEASGLATTVAADGSKPVAEAMRAICGRGCLWRAMHRRGSLSCRSGAVTWKRRVGA